MVFLGDGWKSEAWVTQTGFKSSSSIGSHGDKTMLENRTKDEFFIIQLI
jgi:hypothetical protein